VHAGEDVAEAPIRRQAEEPLTSAPQIGHSSDLGGAVDVMREGDGAEADRASAMPA
jgi:hypothetical protein